MPLLILGDGIRKAAVAEKYPGSGMIFQFKAVAQADHTEAQLRFIIIPHAIAGYLFHDGFPAGVLVFQRDILVPAVQNHTAQVVFRRLQAEQKPPGLQAKAIFLGGFMANCG